MSHNVQIKDLQICFCNATLEKALPIAPHVYCIRSVHFFLVKLAIIFYSEKKNHEYACHILKDRYLLNCSLTIIVLGENTP